MSSARKFFSEVQVKEIESAIQAAEQNSSGEIRVHVENHSKEDAVNAAERVFAKLSMHKTELRNGVLFYLATQDKKFAVIGDKGIHLYVPEKFWDKVRDIIQGYFVKGNFAEGLCAGIAMTGVELKKHFPVSKNDINELSNEVTFDKS